MYPDIVLTTLAAGWGRCRDKYFAEVLGMKRGVKLEAADPKISRKLVNIDNANVPRRAVASGKVQASGQ